MCFVSIFSPPGPLHKRTVVSVEFSVIVRSYGPCPTCFSFFFAGDSNAS